MRLYWYILSFSVIGFIHTLESKKDLDQETEVSANEKLSEHCSEFVKNCIQLCQDETIESFSSNCSAREASCQCNEKDLSAMVFDNLLSNVEQQTQLGKKKELQVETNDNLLSPVQFKAIINNEQIEEEQEKDYMAEEEQENYQDMEYIYPRHDIMKRPTFQQSFCSKFLIRCKQDCPAAFNSYFCDVNQVKTGFLLSCICNGVDLAASVNAQVQAESF